ncbi:MAG: rod shape-determining protein MreC [Saprospiraceae bacterium]
MFRIFELFLRLSGFFVFLLLEIICFILIVKYNHQQQVIYENSTNLFSAYLQKKSKSFADYMHLTEVNDSLAKENAFLLSELANMPKGAGGGIDSSRLNQLDTTFQVIPARVISNSVNRYHNFIVLDKGSRHGVVPHTGVVTANGVVGIVRRVAPSSSVAMSVLHLQTRISARVRDKGYFGWINWTGKNTRSFKLNDVPKDALVALGDTIETSGYSAIFPEGIMLGTIEKIGLEPGSNYYSLDVKYSTDLSRLSWAYIVKDLRQREKLELLDQVISDDE